MLDVGCGAGAKRNLDCATLDDSEPVDALTGGQICARCPASRLSCPPRKRPGAGSDFGRSSRWPGAAGWRPRGGGAARPARGVAQLLPAPSAATIWPLYA